MLSHEISECLNAYASASKGYISGGFNLTLAQDWSYEAGLGTHFPDGKGYLNLAAFYIESDNWQEVRVLTDDMGRVASSAFIGTNANIESAGFEGATVREGLLVEEVNFFYDHKKLGTTVKELCKTTQFTTNVVVQRNRLNRTRALFPQWSATFVLDCDEEVVDVRNLEEVAANRWP